MIPSIHIQNRRISLQDEPYIIAEMSANFPLGGNCRYAGMVERNGVFYISYYLSYEYANAVIYIATVSL